MNAIKDKIRQHLAKVTEATAKKIGVAIGLKDYPTDVVNALSEMRIDAEVECEKRKGHGNELWYWLTNVGSVVTLTNEGDMPSDEVAELRKHLADLTAENAGFCSLIEEQRREIKKLASELGHARIQVDALNEQLMQGEDAVDVKEAARGYLVCAPKRKPAKLMKAESAVARAKSAAKATGRSEVFALVPVGTATRKQIQAVEFKERAA